MNWKEIQQQTSVEREVFTQKLNQEMGDVQEREAFMESMRIFKQREEKTLAEENQITPDELCLRLTALGEVCLASAYAFEKRFLATQYGMAETDFYLVAMGKFGGCELNVQSDLDVIYIFMQHGQTEGAKPITYQEFFVRLVQRLISNLSILTRNGRVYEVDVQLRPSGRAGTLVSSWEAFQDYHRHDARIWEKQSLLRARPVVGPSDGQRELARDLADLIWVQAYGPKIATEIHRIRVRMERELAKEADDAYNIKVGPGGLVDIEFIVQFLQLRFGREQPALLSPHTGASLRTLQAEGLLQEASAAKLEEAYYYYRRLETRLRALLGRSADRLPRQPNDTTEALVLAMGEANLQGLLERYETYRSNVRQIYLETLGI